MRTVTVSLALALAAGPLAAPLVAQQGAKPLTPDTYDAWRQIQGAQLSPDGQWVAYTLTPVVGDGETVVRATRGATEYRQPRGWTGRPIVTTGTDSAWSAQPVQWSPDAHHALWLAYAPRAEFEKARREKRRPADQPKATLAILRVRDGDVVRVPNVKSFRVPRERTGWVAYLLEADSAQARAGNAPRDTSARPAAGLPTVAATPGGTPRPVADSARAGGARRELGTTLVLRELESGREVRIPDVVAYAFSDSGRWIGYTVASRDRARDGAYLRVVGQDREIALATGQGNYRALTFDRAERQVAFVTDRDDQKATKPRFALYHAALASTQAAPQPRAIVTAGMVGEGERVSERALSFTRDGSAIVLGVAGAPVDSIPADSLYDKAVFDLWNWKDPRLQPQQRLEANRDRDRSNTAVYQTAARRLVRLGSDSLPRVTVSDDGRWALGLSDVPYAIEAMWGEDGTDAWLLDARTGTRKKIAEKLDFGAQLSPGAAYVTFFRDRKWWTYATATGTTTDLTGRLAGVRFDQEEWDTPSTAAPYGVAGWTAGDRSMLVYGRYDIWELDPSGKRAPRVVTDSVGSRRRIAFRLVDLDPEERYLTDDLLLRAFDDSTKGSGFWRDRLAGSDEPRPIVMADAQFGTPTRARHAATMLVTRQTVSEFPNVWAGERLDSLTRLTDANPQQKDYRWANVELVKWTSDDGVPLEGLLYTPQDFDAKKQYPMVVYFYERYSDTKHQYYAPTGRNVVNPVVYASKGYLVFIPDIAYTTGYPGQNALHAIVPGVQSLVARGFVDRAHVGIAGQSWGGYQTAYIITQTPMFAAAMAGAPVANMTSAYGGIRWESGVARAFQYEKGQSRIGGSLWQYPMRFIENSPLFYVDRVTTPVLIMSNDADGAVPWYQGIELFVGLRRFKKEAYLVNYNGDAHNPRKRANQKDIDMRMQQFFDHHLKGAPAPEWMEKGIPFLQKGREAVTMASAPEPGAPTTSTTTAPASGSASTTGATTPKP